MAGALQTRIHRLEALAAARGQAGMLARLVLLTGPHGPTAEQQAQATAARHQGREVFVIKVTAGRAS